jgi:hypothetical protein
MADQLQIRPFCVRWHYDRHRGKGARSSDPAV